MATTPETADLTASWQTEAVLTLIEAAEARLADIESWHLVDCPADERAEYESEASNIRLALQQFGRDV